MLINWTNYFLHLIKIFGYPGIIAAMFVESTFLPLPSEIIIPPAAYLAAQGKFNIFLLVAFGVLGNILGALFNYFLARTLGRKIIYGLADSRAAHWLFISREKLERSEKYYLAYGKSATFIGRLVPAVRHLISIPAGLAKMKLMDFILYTILGSLLWDSILAALGYFFGANQTLVQNYYKQISVVLLLVGVGFVVWIIFRKKRPNISDVNK